MMAVIETSLLLFDEDDVADEVMMPPPRARLGSRSISEI
jgi:hypothetical protein